jgi:rhodanese-related sulfurtransferase
MMNFLKSILNRPGDAFGPDEAAALIDKGAPVIDVREPDEFEAGAIPGAINVPLGQIQSHGLDALRRANIDIDAPVIVLACRSGARSGSACTILRDALGMRARNLSGGVLAWTSHGLRLTPGGRIGA